MFYCVGRREKDELYTNDSARNLIVVRNGHLYSVDILDKDSKLFHSDVKIR